MLYPDFNDLVALKNVKRTMRHSSSRSVKTFVSGNHHSPFRGQGLEFDSVREYVPGDDIRNIDWRVTARIGAPHLKIFKEDRERHIVVCVDMNSGMRFGTKNTFKSIQAARAAALLCWQGLAQHDCVSACLFGDVPEGIQYFAPKRTRKSFYTMLRMLSEPLEDRHQTSINATLQHINKTSQSGSLVYVISDFMDFDSQVSNEAVLSKLSKKCDIVFIAFNDPADQSLSPIGTIGFCANQAEKMYVDTENLLGRNAYEALWKENRQRLYELTSKYKIFLVELSTESDVPRDLMLGLKTLAKRKQR